MVFSKCNLWSKRLILLHCRFTANCEHLQQNIFVISIKMSYFSSSHGSSWPSVHTKLKTWAVGLQTMFWSRQTQWGENWTSCVLREGRAHVLLWLKIPIRKHVTAFFILLVVNPGFLFKKSLKNPPSACFFLLRQEFSQSKNHQLAPFGKYEHSQRWLQKIFRVKWLSSL